MKDKDIFVLTDSIIDDDCLLNFEMDIKNKIPKSKLKKINKLTYEKLGLGKRNTSFHKKFIQIAASFILVVSLFGFLSSQNIFGLRNVLRYIPGINALFVENEDEIYILDKEIQTQWEHGYLTVKSAYIRNNELQVYIHGNTNNQDYLEKQLKEDDEKHYIQAYDKKTKLESKSKGSIKAISNNDWDIRASFKLKSISTYFIIELEGVKLEINLVKAKDISSIDMASSITKSDLTLTVIPKSNDDGNLMITVLQTSVKNDVIHPTHGKGKENDNWLYLIKDGKKYKYVRKDKFDNYYFDIPYEDRSEYKVEANCMNVQYNYEDPIKVEIPKPASGNEYELNKKVQILDKYITISSVKNENNKISVTWKYDDDSIVKISCLPENFSEVRFDNVSDSSETISFKDNSESNSITLDISEIIIVIRDTWTVNIN